MTIEEKREIEVGQERVEAYFYRPDGIEEFPAILFLTDICGIRPANMAMAKRLCDQGFAVLLPNILHRYAKIEPGGLEPEEETARRALLGRLI